jgi:hypothetical protein
MNLFLALLALLSPQVGRGKKAKTIPAHRLVLAASSPLFEAMLYPPTWANANAIVKEPLEIVVKDTTPEAFEGLLRCVYTDEVSVDSSNVAQYIDVGKKYQIEKLQMLCSKFMTADINMDNALELFQIAPDLLGDEEFGLEFIRENSEEVFASPGILTLNKDRFITLLKDDGLGIEEVELFNCCRKWAEAQVKAEGKDEKNVDLLQVHLKDVLPLIRFPIMDVTEIATHVATSGLLAQQDLLQLFKYVSITDEKAKGSCEVPFITKPRDGSFGGAKGSKLMDRKYKKDIVKMFGKDGKGLKFKLLYQGSKDGFTGSAFHQKCDDQGPTFTIIKAKQSGNVFGGYTDRSWAGNGKYESSSKAFVYSLVNKTGKTVKFLPSQTNNHTYCHTSYGPTWGGGHDLHVNNSMTANSNYCSPNTYVCVRACVWVCGSHFYFYI